MEHNFPKYVELPESVAGYRCSWEYFNSLRSNADMKDQLGTLNFLTSERIARAAQELIMTGSTIRLDLPIDHFTDVINAFGGRSPPSHSMKNMGPFSFDDSLSFNTQSASQWDGLRHFGLSSTCQFYNAHHPDEFKSSDILGIQAWAMKGGIFGRCLLVDFCAWAEHRGESVDVNSGRAITLNEVKQVLNFQGTHVRPGDILLFRTGFLKWYNETPQAERYEELCVRNAPGQHKFIGMAQELAFIEWLWDSQIAAVAGDQVALEATPPPEGGIGMLHEHLLAALGCPIGELWDTETIAATCKRRGKYEFFLASTPLYLRGGVATPANAVALL